MRFFDITFFPSLTYFTNCKYNLASGRSAYVRGAILERNETEHERM